MVFWTKIVITSRPIVVYNKSIKNTKNIVPKVKFVREQRVFGKSVKAVVKKRANVLIRQIKLVLYTGLLSLQPPLSTVLTLFGLNTIKFVEEYNKKNTLFFASSLPIHVNLQIFSDLSHKIQFGYFKQSITIQSLSYLAHCNFLFSGKLIYAPTELIQENDFNFHVSKKFSFLDLWYFSFIKSSLSDAFINLLFINGLILTAESYYRVLHAMLRSFSRRDFRFFLLK